jgi:hypothetical protein
MMHNSHVGCFAFGSMLIKMHFSHRHSAFKSLIHLKSFFLSLALILRHSNAYARQPYRCSIQLFYFEQVDHSPNRLYILYDHESRLEPVIVKVVNLKDNIISDQYSRSLTRLPGLLGLHLNVLICAKRPIFIGISI